MGYAVELRLAYIDWRLKSRGGVNRSDIQRAFDISKIQASNDLTSFARQFEGRMVYNASTKRYEPKGRQVFKNHQHQTAIDVANFFAARPSQPVGA